MLRNILAWLGLAGGKVRNVRADAFEGPILHYVYENKRQPDGFGASRYAFETLSLTPSSPIDGGAVRVRRQISFPFSGPQVWAGLALKIDPTPSQSGGIYSGGMVTEDGDIPKLGTYSAIDMAGVARNDPMAGANLVSAVYGPNNPV